MVFYVTSPAAAEQGCICSSCCLDLLTNEKPDERQIMTYVSCYYHAFQGAMQVCPVSRVPPVCSQMVLCDISADTAQCAGIIGYLIFEMFLPFGVFT